MYYYGRLTTHCIELSDRADQILSRPPHQKFVLGPVHLSKWRDSMCNVHDVLTTAGNSTCDETASPYDLV